MKTRAERALHLCGEYDRLMERIKDMTTQIGNALNQCPIYVNAPIGEPVGSVRTHLKQAYESEFEHFDWGGKRRVWLDEDEKVEILAACSHCSIAHTYIQNRKAARKALGIVKRQIRMIGRGATDEKA